ncbi:MAG: STAS domain-containing protein [Oscillospiraceae bacterium]
MTINQNKTTDALVLELEGRLDTITAPELEEVVEKIPEDVNKLIVDMAKLEYISSAGLRVILAAHKLMCEERTGTMTVKNVSDGIMEIFDMTGFTDVLNIEE